MHRFTDFEQLGARVVAISDKSDGDCGAHAESFEGRRSFVERCGAPYERLACASQTHSIKVVTASNPERKTGADGLITNEPGAPLGITVADCVPVFLFDPKTFAGGVLHAGREGTRHNISRAGVAFLGERYGVKPEHLHALIGPSAGPCCYEVSESMAEDFAGAGLPVRGRFLDLWRANHQQLGAAGVPSGQIVTAGHCTICGGGYHSFRGDGTLHRNLALFML